MRTATCLTALALVGFVALGRADDKPPEPKQAEKPKVEVVFCLDTTGSMGGLIDGAKAKIWAICNQIAGGKPTPQLKVGLVAFRDKGDEYVTKVTDLTDDLDAIYAELKKFAAGGGGDGPEAVNQALDDSVNKVKWSDDKKTLRIIFLVGDAPPHMDYMDDVKFPETCKKACEKGIIINSIQCGNNAECAKFWKEICVKAEGSYVNIAQDGGVQPVVATPFDKRLGEINAEVARTTLVFGDRDRQDQLLRQNREAEGLKEDAAAGRIAFQAKNKQAAAYDLLDNLKSGKADLNKLNENKELLPPELKDKTVEQQKAYLADLDKKRDGLLKEAAELDKKRQDFIQAKQAEEAKKAGFDGQVLEMLRNQAKKAGIDY